MKNNVSAWLAAIVLLAATAGCSWASTPIPADQDFTGSIQEITDPALAEISGITASSHSGKRYWLLNDSDNKPHIYQIDKKGRVTGQITVAGTRNTDWEDLSRFTFKDKAYLLVADVGDNFGSRKQIKLHWIKEPKKQNGHKSKLWEKSISPTTTLTVEYEDGPRDAEAVAVDSNNQYIYIITKRDKPPRLYRLPLKKSKKTVMAKFVTSLKKHPAPSIKDILSSPRFGPHRYSPTALDFSPDGKSAAVLTYHHLFIYKRSKKESWEQAFNKKPKIFIKHQLKQAEAASFSRSGNQIVFTSEKLPAPLLFLDW